jgi:hypothetical protein
VAGCHFSQLHVPLRAGPVSLPAAVHIQTNMLVQHSTCVPRAQATLNHIHNPIPTPKPMPSPCTPKWHMCNPWQPNHGHTCSPTCLCDAPEPTARMRNATACMRSHLACPAAVLPPFFLHVLYPAPTTHNGCASCPRCAPMMHRAHRQTAKHVSSPGGAALSVALLLGASRSRSLSANDKHIHLTLYNQRPYCRLEE